MSDAFEIHVTDKQTFKTCRQKWQFSSNLQRNLEPKLAYEPFWIGTAFHEALGHYYDPDSQRDMDNAIVIARQHVQAWYTRLEEVSDADTETYDKWMLTLPAMLRNYAEFAEDPANDDRDNFDVMWTEREFHIPIPGLGEEVTYSFRTDGLVMDRQGNLWILEHKTAASFPGNTDYLMMDDQVGSYLWALEEVFDLEIEGVIYNWVKKKVPVIPEVLKNGKFSKNKAQDTTYDIALNAYRTAGLTDAQIQAEYGEFLTHLQIKENNFVRRERVRRNRHEIQVLGQSLQHEISDMISDPAIYRSPSKFACNGCPFFTPCLVRWEGGDYEAILSESFKQREKPRRETTEGA